MIRKIIAAVFALVLPLTLGAVAPARAQDATTDPALYPGEKVVEARFPASGPLVLDGWTRDGRGHVYHVAVKKGQKYEIRFLARNRYAGLVIFDTSLAADEEGIYASEENGSPATVTAAKDTVWLIRPFYNRMSPRRGAGAPYQIRITPKG